MVRYSKNNNNQRNSISEEKKRKKEDEVVSDSFDTPDFHWNIPTGDLNKKKISGIIGQHIKYFSAFFWRAPSIWKRLIVSNKLWRP